MFDSKKYPNTAKYVLENDTQNIRCNCCGSVVLKETFVEGYPYQCMACDVNLYAIETHKGEYHSEQEFDQLCWDTLALLCLDQEEIINAAN